MASPVIAQPSVDEPQDHLSNVPVEIVEMMMLRLAVRDILSVSITCRTLRDITNDSTALQNAIRFKSPSAKERKWQWKKSTGLTLAPDPAESAKSHSSGDSDHTIRMMNSTIASQLERKFSRHKNLSAAQKITHETAMRIAPDLWLPAINPDATCLEMQITQPPSTKLDFLGERTHPGARHCGHESTTSRAERTRTILNEDGITLGDIREQAKDFLGKKGLLVGETQYKREGRFSELFLTEEQIQWVEDGYGRVEED